MVAQPSGVTVRTNLKKQLFIGFHVLSLVVVRFLMCFLRLCGFFLLIRLLFNSYLRLLTVSLIDVIRITFVV